MILKIDMIFIIIFIKYFIFRNIKINYYVIKLINS